MKFNFIFYRLTFLKTRLVGKINFVELSLTYSETKYEIKLSSTINGFFHTDNFVFQRKVIKMYISKLNPTQIPTKYLFR